MADPRVRSLVVDEALHRTLAGALLRAQQGTVAFQLLCTAIVMGGVIGWVINDFWGMLVAIPAVLVLVPLVMRRGMRKQLGVQLPAGSPLETVFDEDSLTIRTPTTSSSFTLSSMTGLRRIGEVVVFKQGGSRTLCALPVALFPDEERARITPVGEVSRG